MSPQHLRELLRACPFVPLRLHTTEGRAYEIRHPSEAIVLLTRVVLASPSQRKNEFPETLEHIALAHIVRVEDLPGDASRSAG